MPSGRHTPMPGRFLRISWFLRGARKIVDRRGRRPLEHIVMVVFHLKRQTEENNGILPTFVDVFGKTHTFRTKDSQGMVSQHATQINDDIMRRARELRAEWTDNPDLDAIFLELHGKVKKRKQIPGAGSVTKLYFPSAYASGRSTGSDPDMLGFCTVLRPFFGLFLISKSQFMSYFAYFIHFGILTCFVRNVHI
ncbi:uncharacterized protein LOC121745057 [Salvia splendens]|uniref:uncharacterized protein LOC121745057 n=1 Tax=Salvia splendens TaxID=180675 RepID=UPI001C27E820|nr:uncharacterized protein LOC121745057 [Salvia splendens]